MSTGLTPKSDQKLLGGLGRLGSGRHGLRYLCSCSGAIAARPAASFGHGGKYAEYRHLWRPAVCALPDRLGLVVSMGTRRRPLWTSAHADGDYLVLFRYSAFTLAGAVSTNVWELGLFRLLAGISIGGEWTLGGILVAEEIKPAVYARTDSLQPGRSGYANRQRRT